MSDTTPPADGQVPPPPPPAATPAPAGPYTPAGDQQAAAWAHLGLIASFIVPLIIWLIGKDRGPKTNLEGKEALNAGIWQAIYFVAYQIVSSILLVITFGLWGFVGWIPALAFWIVIIIYAVQAFGRVNAGGSYKWPKWLNPVPLVK